MSPAQTLARRRAGSRVPALRLLPDPGPAESRTQSESLRGHDTHPPTLRVIAGPTRILLAGADVERRAALLDELSQTLPESTVFEQADAVCEALEHACGSRMAFIAGDLDDAPAESLMQTLAHRHPELPVLIVDGPAEAYGQRAVYNDELRLRHG
jgi:predicted exporter